MKRNTSSIILLIAAIALVVSLWQNSSDAVAPEGVQVDYLIVRAGELGVIISPSSNPSNTNLNCTLATKKMNELASKGWRYRDIIYTGETSGVLFERQR